MAEELKLEDLNPGDVISHSSLGDVKYYPVRNQERTELLRVQKEDDDFCYVWIKDCKKKVETTWIPYSMPGTTVTYGSDTITMAGTVDTSSTATGWYINNLTT